jgi:hypothetical protein
VEDRSGAFIVPLPEHAVEEIEVGSDRDRIQEIAADALDAIGHALRLQERQPRLDPMGAIEQDAAEIGI